LFEARCKTLLASFWEYVWKFDIKVRFEGDDSKHTAAAAAAGLFNFTLSLLPDRFRFSADEVRRYVNRHKPPKFVAAEGL